MMDLRDNWERRRWNLICDRWLLVALFSLYLLAASHFGVLMEALLALVLVPFLTLVFLVVVWEGGKRLIEWLQGY